MTATPSFVLSGPSETLVAHGIHTAYPDVDAARSALRSEMAPIVLGTLPFDITGPAALMRPQTHAFGDALPSWPQRPLPAVQIAATIPSPDEHAARISRALTALRDPGTGLAKVVLARALDVAADTPLDALTVLTRLRSADPHAYSYLADLTAAGSSYAATMLVGASPELLVARFGERVTCQPFAGSAPRSSDPHTDRATAAALAASSKDHHEHALVVDAVRRALDPLCIQLEVPPTPQLSRTAALWHLSTPISGQLRESSCTALDLALTLHPTPAVGGVPAAAAAAMIAELEGDRGFYAGATGWCEANGDGRWVVAIRCAHLSADRRTARAYSGGGIVADSDVDDEVAETTTKFRTVLGALGVPA